MYFEKGAPLRAAGTRIMRVVSPLPIKSCLRWRRISFANNFFALPTLFKMEKVECLLTLNFFAQ